MLLHMRIVYTCTCALLTEDVLLAVTMPFVSPCSAQSLQFLLNLRAWKNTKVEGKGVGDGASIETKYVAKLQLLYKVSILSFVFELSSLWVLHIR